ncbi:hypothetical protein ZWY2020_031522 [Hordeum vulgare]|nr:hypothetical protein ZWY2020_031522 [Hordeum vulgare]
MYNPSGLVRTTSEVHLYRMKSFESLSTGKSKSPGRWALVSLVLLVIPRGFFLAFSCSGSRLSICSAARLLAVSVAGFSSFFQSYFSMSSISRGSLMSWNIFLSSASTSILDLVSFGSSSTDGYAPSTSDAGRPSGKLVMSESSSSLPSTLCVRLYE